jgi:hypothetical protein
VRRLVKALAVLTILLILTITLPILFIETACRGTPIEQEKAIYITSTDDHRLEARTYLTYPEWHIVYAYEGYAEALKNGQPHDYPYVRSVFEFWSSLCALTKKSDTLGKAGFDAKSTIYTIGTSFTLEMTAKALYEETIGRVASWSGASPQDQIEEEMAAEYAKFLQQIPWYKFDFDGWTTKLRQAPTTSLRSHERSLALTLEWKTKAAYARLIAKAVAGIGADELTMKIAVTGVDPQSLPSATLIETQGEITILEVPRYRAFTELANTIAKQGGTILEIAGNDDILVSMIIERGDFYPSHGHVFLNRSKRVGFSSDRILLAVKTTDLQHVFTGYPNTPIRVEHIYDY